MPRRSFLTLIAALAVAGLVPVGTASADPALTVEDLTGTATAEDLAEAIAGGAVSNVTTQGPAHALGTFSGGADVLGLDAGVVLSTGLVSDVPGPNSDPLISQDNGDSEGDDDLEALPGYGRNTKDAAVLAFDFVPTASTFSVDFVFSSDEYAAAGDTQRNPAPFQDVLGIFVDGTNCALAGADIVSSLTVSPVSHADLYVDNTDGSLNTEMDGLTTVLTCAAAVTEGEPTHVKIAVADGTDYKGDANVFLGAAETAGTDLAVSKADTPDPVSGGGVVQYLVEVENLGPEDSSVTLTDTPSDGEIISASGTGWSCDVEEDGSAAECTLPELAAEDTADPVEVLVEAPEVEEETTIENVATVTGDGDDPDPDNNTATEETTVQPAGEDFTTFCPPGGCTLSTGEEPDPNDTTVNNITVPPGGDGSTTTLEEGVTTFVCPGSKNQLGDDSLGQETNFVPPTGLVDPTNPIVVQTTWDESVWPEHTGKDSGSHSGKKSDGQAKICVKKVTEEDGVTTETVFRLQACKQPGVANPDPCYESVVRDADTGDVTVTILMTSEDPRWAR